MPKKIRIPPLFLTRVAGLVLASLALPANGQVLLGNLPGKDGMKDILAIGGRREALPDMKKAIDLGAGKKLLSDAVKLTIVKKGELDFDPWTGRDRVIASGQKGWRYLDTKEGPPDDWIKPEFDDSKWKKGDAPLGYGNNGGTKIVTELGYGDDANNKYRAAFFRLRFKVDDPEAAETWVARVVVDDGAMFYLNGKEVQRVRMPKGEVDANTYSAIKTGGSSGLEGKWVNFEISPDALVEGENVLCASVHQADADSSDLVLNIEMFGATPKEFAAAERARAEREKREKEAREQAARVAPVNMGIQMAQPNVLRIFDDRMQAEHTKIKHLIRSLKTAIGISDDQVAELTLCSDNALQRLREEVKRRSEKNEVQQNMILSEVYQGKVAIQNEQGFVEAFAAILEPEQLEKYSRFVKERKERQVEAMVNMFLANLDNGLFMVDEQRDKMREFLKNVANDPQTKRSYYSYGNPLNAFYQIQNAFSRMASRKDDRLKAILNEDQMEMLLQGTRTGSIYMDGFVEVDDVLVPIE